MKNPKSDTEKDKLIKKDKRIGISKIIRQNNVIDQQYDKKEKYRRSVMC